MSGNMENLLVSQYVEAKNRLVSGEYQPMAKEELKEVFVCINTDRTLSEMT